MRPPYGCTAVNNSCCRNAPFCCQDCGEARCKSHNGVEWKHAESCVFAEFTTTRTMGNALDGIEAVCAFLRWGAEP